MNLVSVQGSIEDHLGFCIIPIEEISLSQVEENFECFGL